MATNFVAVSAVSNYKQLSKIAQIAKEEGFRHPLAIGYQVSNKSINQGTQGVRQPPFSELAYLDRATRDYGLTTAIHYYTKDNETILDDLEKIAQKGIEPARTLLQFNTLPPTPETMRKVKKMGYHTIFKVAVSNKASPQGGFAVWKGDGVQDVSSGDITPLVQQVRDRKDSIDYVMFDPSHGTNLGLDLSADSLAIRFGREIDIREEFEGMGLVYAGGLGPHNIREAKEILESHFPGRISVDTESAVRTNDELDIEKVREYLKGC